MKIALFGGAFNPVHSGHLAAAQAAQEGFQLDGVLFVPAQSPPHKSGRDMADFTHRYAMVALACASNPAFVPSLLEADGSAEPNYSIVTVRKMAAQMSAADQLFFLVGADAFLGIRTWKEPVALLDACDFIIVSRPGFAMEQIAQVIPDELRPLPPPAAAPSPEHIALRRTILHLLTTVHSDVSASEIRRRAARREPLCGLVPDAVSDYIRKTRLYGDSEKTQ